MLQVVVYVPAVFLRGIGRGSRDVFFNWKSKLCSTVSAGHLSVSHTRRTCHVCCISQYLCILIQNWRQECSLWSHIYVLYTCMTWCQNSGKLAMNLFMGLYRFSTTSTKSGAVGPSVLPLVYVFVCENVCQCPQISLLSMSFSLHATVELTPGWGRHLLLTRSNCIPNVYFVVIVSPP